MATLAGVQTDAADAAAEPAAVPADGGLGFGQVVAGITAIVAPATLVTGIAYYFGWVHTDAWARYFGLDPSVLGFTTRDYVLASLRPLFLPVVCVLVVLIAFALAHAFVDRTVETDLAKHYSALWKASVIVGAALLVSGAVAVFGTVSTHYLFGTLAPAAGVVLITYGISLRRRLHGQPRLPASTHVLVALLAVLSFFWAAGIYAGKVGHATAADLAKHLKQLPGAVVYSQRDLDIAPGYGVRVVRLTQGSEFPIAYTGFRLLGRSDGKYFLLPRWWTPHDGALAVVLPETDSWRIALLPGVKVHSTLSALEGGGLIGQGVAQQAAAGAKFIYVGPLQVGYSQNGGFADISYTNRTSRAVRHVVLRVAFKPPAVPLVTTDHGSCTVSLRRFTCVSNLGPQGAADVKITEQHGKPATATTLLRVGPARHREPLGLDPRRR